MFQTFLNDEKQNKTYNKPILFLIFLVYQEKFSPSKINDICSLNVN